MFSLCLVAVLAAANVPSVDYSVQLETVTSGFDGKTCWVHARAGAIPGEPPTVVMTMQKLLLTGSDVFYALNEMRSDNLGKAWDGPREHETLGRRQVEDDAVAVVCDFTPKWHAKTKTLLGTGHSARYKDNRLIRIRPRYTAYATYDLETRAWTEWKRMQMPPEPKFYNAGAGSTQRVDLPNGDILLPVYFKAEGETQNAATVVRCGFDGKTLSYIEHGTEMTIPVQRGFCEPSLAFCNGRYFLTLRNDEAGYVTSGEDGLHFDEPVKWRFDDGAELGNYNTQQHWVVHGDALFLVYTRRGLDNDHVFRHRAPLVMAQVDPDRLCVIRDTERVLVPERGARLGNFGVADVSENETWVTVTEWMQPVGCEKYGSDNTVYAARIRWQEKQAGAAWPRHTIDNTSRGADGVRLADVNGDGLPEIATGWEEGGVVKVYNHPGPARVKEPWPGVVVGRVAWPEDAVFADVDHDGALDVVSACEGDDRTVYVHWAPKNGEDYYDAGKWKTEALPASQDRTKWMFIAPKEDGAGSPALFCGARGDGAAVGVFHAGKDARALGEWSWKRLYEAEWIMSMRWVDMDGNGTDDLLFTDRKGKNRGCHWLTPDGQLHTAGLRDYEVMFLDTGDLDGDGRIDIVCATKGGPIMRLERDESGAWTETPIPMPGKTGTGKGIGLGDMNGDGRTDIVFTCELAKNLRGVMALMQKPDGSFAEQDTGGLEGTKFDRIELVDLDRDGDLDVLTCEERDNLGVIWYENPLKP